MNGLELYDQLHAVYGLHGLLDIFLATITQLLDGQQSQSIESAPLFISSENGHHAPIEGTIQVDNRADEGARFLIQLPLIPSSLKR
jgi:hypothetical protein